MPTLVADVAADIEAVVGALVGSGLTLQHPSTTAISVCSAGGDNLVVRTEAEALKHWHSGASLQLWSSEADDLALGHFEAGVRLFFDGCSARQVAGYLSALINHNLAYSVGPED